MAQELSHTATLRIPFFSAEHALIAKRSLDVDREVNMDLVERVTAVEGEVLVVTFRAATVRLLRLASNAFIASTDLVLRTMGEFAPDADEPRITDEELAAEAKKSHTEWESTKGIELPGAPDEPRR